MDKKKEILETITILCSGKNIPGEMKAHMYESVIDIESLRNVAIIAVENNLHGGRLQDFYGIDMAYDMLIKEPSKKIILYHVTPVEFLRKKKQKLDILLAKPNIRLLEMPFSIETIVSVFESKNIEIDSQNTKDALDEYIKRELSVIWHDIRKAPDPLNPEQGWQTDIVAKGIKIAKDLFPMLTDKDNSFVLKFLEETSAIREEVCKGKIFNGIFCDIEGTFFSNDILNSTLLEFLQKQEIKGQTITLWTDGDISKLQSLLNVRKITYPLRAKRDFAGAIVEMAIDDMDEHSFSVITKIYAKKFRQVQYILD
jgi:hypothetical protein